MAPIISVSPTPLGTNWILELIGTRLGLGLGTKGWGQGLTIWRWLALLVYRVSTIVKSPDLMSSSMLLWSLLSWLWGNPWHWANRMLDIKKILFKMFWSPDLQYFWRKLPERDKTFHVHGTFSDPDWMTEQMSWLSFKPEILGPCRDQHHRIRDPYPQITLLFLAHTTLFPESCLNNSKLKWN